MTFEKNSNGYQGYNGNTNVKADGVAYEYNEWELEEYIKCSEDPAYFARNYVKVIHLDHGLVPFDLYPYQEKMFDHFESSRFTMVLACRQSGKSISSVAYLLWYSIFKSDKTIAVLANKGSTSQEMLARVTLMLENLPFFLQPGCKVLNKKSIEFSNNSRIIAAATSSSSIRGFSINLLYLDEFAFVENDATFYTSTYPVITSGKTTKVIITSTANGIGNVFYKLWEGAVQATNSYKPFRVDWWDVPGRDEEWKRETISNTSELQFNQEYGNQFIGSSNTLISPDALLGLKSIDPIFFKDDVMVYDYPKEDHKYIMTVDVAQGRGLDSSTFNIIDITTKPFNQSVVFKSSLISPLMFPAVILKYAHLYNMAYCIIESNDQGIVVANHLYHEYEYENLHVGSIVKSDDLGVKMTKRVKQQGCSNLKDIVESGQLQIHDMSTIIELSTFVAKGASYEASKGNHDDLAMNLVLFSWFTTTDIFKMDTDIDMSRLLYMDSMKAIEEDVMPFGYNTSDMHIEQPTNPNGWVESEDDPSFWTL
jgi:hypothetical protein